MLVYLHGRIRVTVPSHTIAFLPVADFLHSSADLLRILPTGVAPAARLHSHTLQHLHWICTGSGKHQHTVMPCIAGVVDSRL